MAKLLFSSAEILNTSDSSQGAIYNITVDGVEASLEPNTVAVEDNREINESFVGRITIRTKNTNFGVANDGTAILDSAYVSTDGTTPFEGKIRLNGKVGSHTLTTSDTYIQGHNAFDNGRREVVLVAQVEGLSTGESTSAIVVSS